MTGADAFSYADTEAPAALATLAKQLRAPHTKDAAVRLLKEAVQIIEGLAPSEAAKQSVERLAAALSEEAVLQHTDQGVQIYAAACFVHSLRITAPEAPYTVDSLQALFSRVLRSLGALAKPSAPCYRLCLSVLHTVAKVRCMLLLWDLPDESLVESLFQTLLGGLNTKNQEDVEHLVFETLSYMIEEADDIPQGVVDAMFECMNATEGSPACARIVERLLKQHESALGIYIQKSLSSIIESAGDPFDSYHNILLQIHRATPELLLPVLPHLSSQLVNEDEARRMAAVHVAGKLFSEPSTDVAEEHPELLATFLGRFKDQRVDVRLAAVGYAADVVAACVSAPLKDQVFSAASSRQSDPDERVRAKAVHAVCTAGAAQLALVGADALQTSTARLNDVKPHVRREAGSALAALFKAACRKLHEETITDLPLHILRIPECILCQSAVDPKPEMRSFLETLLQSGLFPGRLPSARVAQIWVLVYAQSGEHYKGALSAVLSRRFRFQEHVLHMLQQRQESQQGVSSSTGNGVEAGVSAVAAYFPDSDKAADHLTRLLESKDKNVCKALAQIARVPDSAAAAEKTVQDLLTRVPTRGGLREFARALAQRLLPAPLRPEHLRAMLQMDLDPGADLRTPMHRTALELACTVAEAAPSLFDWLLDVAEDMLASGREDLQLCACRLLAHTSGRLAGKLGEHELPPGVRRLLSGFCQGSCDKAAKFAAKALAKLSRHDGELGQVRSLMRSMAETIQEEPSCSNQHVLLRSMSGLAQHQPDVFALHARDFKDFVMQTVMTSGPSAEPRGTASGASWSAVSPQTRRKCQAMKLLARALSPLAGSAALHDRFMPLAEEMLAELDGLLDPDNGMEAIHVTGPTDQGHVRLAAAGAMLRLLRVYDASCSPQVYVNLALTLQDPVMEVRATFGDKVIRTAKSFEARQRYKVASKYMAILSLAAMDPSKRNRQQAQQDLHSFVCRRRRHMGDAATAAAFASGGGGVTVPDQPDFILPYVVFLLAHHPDFPEEDDLAAGGPKELDPWQKMMGLAVKQLLAGDAEGEEGGCLPAIMKILSTIKQSGDVLVDGINPKVCTTCDIGLVLCGGKGDLREIPYFPAKIPLPRALYQPADRAKTTALMHIGSHLPAGFKALKPLAALPEQAAKLPGRRAAGGKVTGKRDQPAGHAASQQQTEAPKGGASQPAATPPGPSPPISETQAAAQPPAGGGPGTPLAKKSKVASAEKPRRAQALRDISVNRTPEPRRSKRRAATAAAPSPAMA